jgi:hypothetical protein
MPEKAQDWTMSEDNVDRKKPKEMENVNIKSISNRIVIQPITVIFTKMKFKINKRVIVGIEYTSSDMAMPSI